MNDMQMPGRDHNTVAFSEPITGYRLKRTGQRPYMFNGTELCNAMSYVPGTPFWYEINIYQNLNETFVVEIKMFTKSDNDREMFRVMEVSSLSDVFEKLENYQTAHDIEVPLVNFADTRKSVAEVGLQAAQIRLKMKEASRQFSDLVGQILFELEQSNQ